MYATRNNISTIYGPEFLSDITPVDVPDPEGAVDQALADASAEIDGYLSKKYELPLAGQPKVLRRPCIDIAVYVLANSHTRLTNTIETRYEQATALLTKISKGIVGLGADEPSSVVAGSENGTASGADFTSRPRRFGRGRSDG
jgi:phage gp36-like protein